MHMSNRMAGDEIKCCFEVRVGQHAEDEHFECNVSWNKMT